jgi:CAAX protease family protein
MHGEPMNSSPLVSTPGTAATRHAVAPVWHTVVVLVVLLGASIAGAVNQNQSPLDGAHGRSGGYLLAMAFEWAIVAFIWYGVSRRGVRMADLVGGSWLRPMAILRDLGLAVGFLLVSGLMLHGVKHLLKAAHNTAARNLLPHGLLETIVYLLLALTAGFCEELIFRGYLQRQFAALTDAAAGGIVLQGIAFGVSHGYQGWKYTLVITVFGIFFGLLAHWRNSLRPGMIAHFLQDGIAGVLGSRLMH